MTETSSIAPLPRNATPPHIAPSSTALPTPPASQEKLHVTQQETINSPSRQSSQPPCLPRIKEISKLDREARAANYVLTFGMYKGKSLNDIAKRDHMYISWLKTSGWAHARGDLGDAMALYDRQAVRELHEKYPRALSFKFTFGKYLNKRMTDVPADFMESLIKDKHHMWSRRPGLREALLYWDEWACLGRQNWHRPRMITEEEKEAGIRGGSCRRGRKREARQVVICSIATAATPKQ